VIDKLNLDTDAENLDTDAKSKLTVGQMEIKRKKERKECFLEKPRYDAARTDFLKRDFTKGYFAFVIYDPPGLNLAYLNATTKYAVPKSGASRQSQQRQAANESKKVEPVNLHSTFNPYQSSMERTNVIKDVEAKAKIHAMNKLAEQDRMIGIQRLQNIYKDNPSLCTPEEIGDLLPQEIEILKGMVRPIQKSKRCQF
jgi:hypothetical protein